jgi:ArsR family transcriptional regulator
MEKSPEMPEAGMMTPEQPAELGLHPRAGRRVGQVRHGGSARALQDSRHPATPELVAKLLHGLSDPTRVRILELLIREGELHVSALVERLGQPQGRISAHLGCLRTCGWVTVRREGKFAYYRVIDNRVPLLLALAKDLAADHAAGVLGCPLA